MKKLFISILLGLLLVGMVSAQDEQTPYEIALERILEAERTGATELDLSNLGLVQLPPEIGNLSNLESLLLRDFNYSTVSGETGGLQTLPPEIGNLTKLEVLFLDGNQLNSLPAEIGNLSSLYELVLNHNQLTSLPPEIGNLHNLQLLYLNNNQLTSLPPEFGNLTSLRYLWLDYNQLESLPPELGELGNLRQLNVQGNSLVSIPQEVIAEGTPAILAYLRNEAWYYLQKLIVSGLAVFGLVTLFVLAIRWRNLRGKQKRKNDA